jgi:16S rRNA processing protein RimM
MGDRRIPTDDTIEVGIVVKPHGARGEVRVRLHNPGSAAARSPEALSLRASDRRHAVLDVTPVADGLRVRLEAVEDRETAEGLKGARLELRRDAVELDPGQYLYQDLIGCRVVEGDRSLGRVDRVFEAGSADVLVVRDGALERLIPLVEPWVTEVDLERREIRVTDAEQWEATRTGR